MLPSDIEKEFGYLDLIDAWDNDGWWVGVITGRKDNGDYFVYFEISDDEIAYPVSRLWVHLDWVWRRRISQRPHVAFSDRPTKHQIKISIRQ
ncbi:hypothetical protein G4B88_002395 [Cannabis sativa]|uniref:Agenet domain-containing protein n=1 Tax=Cannabis sativa TaxID=3483 RepID=A0A7J6I7F5_CANSA|nr:hypothetical protein G4B88_002395 [Cannabis sativa]